MSLIDREYYMSQENRDTAEQISFQIGETVRLFGSDPSIVVPLASYLLCKVSQCNNPNSCSYQELIDGAFPMDDDVQLMTKELIVEAMWDKLLPIAARYDANEFALAVLLGRSFAGSYSYNPTPDFVSTLANQILNISETDTLADLGCGTGAYLVHAAFHAPRATFYGYERNTMAATIAKICAELMDVQAHIELLDIFDLPNCNDVLHFNKIFSNYPFGMRQRNLGEGLTYLKSLEQTYPDMSKATSSDWIYNALITDLMTEDGKAVAIMTNGSTWNRTDTAIRKHFIERGLIECVISLPERLFSFTNIPTTMIVFSHHNQSIRMIDATKICQQGRRQNTFDKEDIATILHAIEADSSYSKRISLEELRKNEYTLSLSRYLKDEITFSNAMSFESIIKSITRGAPCTAKQLDAMASAEPTNMQYLMLANIQNGIISDNLPYLSEIDEKFNKYCLNDRNLILSKNGYPYKIAIANVRENQKILANGNLYIIELDEEKANPYYIKAFLESEAGIAVLKSITVGATIPNIGVSELRKVKIPVPPLEVQNRIAQKYQATLDEIEVLKMRLERATNRLHHILDEDGADVC